MTENVDLNLLAKLCQQTLAELRSLRTDVNDVRHLVLQNVDYTRRVERRMGEIGDDLELMIKAEIGGRFAHLETRIENTLSGLSERVTALEES